MPQNRWTAKRVTFLCDNWLVISTRKIAKALGSEFTRNMVIGKAHRLGLPEIYMGERQRRISEGTKAGIAAIAATRLGTSRN